MPSDALSQVLNIVIPIAAFGVFGFMVWKAFGPQMERFWEWFKGLFARKESSSSNNPYRQSTFGGGYNTGRRKSSTWVDGDIQYR